MGQLEMVKRGEIYWVNWNPSRGSEQKGIRPALIIQNDIGNRLSPNTIVASLTTTPNKGYPFMVSLKASECVIKDDSTVDLASIMTVSKSMLGDKCGQVIPAQMKKIDDAIRASLGLNQD